MRKWRLRTPTETATDLIESLPKEQWTTAWLIFEAGVDEHLSRRRRNGSFLSSMTILAGGLMAYAYWYTVQSGADSEKLLELKVLFLPIFGLMVTLSLIATGRKVQMPEDGPH